MKKILMILVCLMTFVSVNAQNKTQAVSIAITRLKMRLKAPSTFILTDRLGNRIPQSNVYAVYHEKSVVKDSIVYYNKQAFVDSIEYYCTKDGVIVDSIVNTSMKKVGIDSVEYIIKTYSPYYEVSFYYEAQNSFGGMVQNFAAEKVIIGDRFCEKTYRKVKRCFLKFDMDNKVLPIKQIYHYSYCPRKLAQYDREHSGLPRWVEIERKSIENMGICFGDNW